MRERARSTSVREARSHRRLWLAGVGSLLLLGAAACGSPATAEEYGVTPTPPLPVSTPVVSYDPAQAIADHDGSVVVSVADGVVTFQEKSGTQQEQRVELEDQHVELRAVSVDGHMAALFARPSDDASRITVVDRRQAVMKTATFDLPGLVEPEAFSTDGDLLYVIDHQIAAADGAYRVRPLNLATGRLETIVGPTKVPLTEDMNGIGRRQVWAPDGTRLYTLYIRQTHHHHVAGEENPHTHGEPGTDAFVHVLDLSEEWAFCLDLPKAFGGGELATTALALSPDGRTVAVADASAESIAFASTETLAVVDVLPLTEPAGSGSLQLGLTAHEVAVGRAQRIFWFDRTTMAELSPEPSTLGASITGFSSTGSGLLAWTDDVERGPVVVSPGV